MDHEPVPVALDWRSPQGRLARERAFRLISARVGAGGLLGAGRPAAGHGYAEELEKVMSELSGSRQELAVATAHLLDVLVHVSKYALDVIRVQGGQSEGEVMRELDNFLEHWSR